MMDMEPDYHLSYVLLGNVYSAIDQWDDALNIRTLMKDRGIKKTPGKSWIDAKSNMSSYVKLIQYIKQENGNLQIRGDPFCAMMPFVMFILSILCNTVILYVNFKVMLKVVFFYNKGI
ncbi:hypothetical protein GIB67_013617 [Kingdonia uniflora]|uniref:Pentatricopeptide repeat-containing protein n=1 Tax=Kingdonia uniflora TaxID=39325 RepID=A0A7J7NPP9_9MAGN|nr:hypothetical protein GIB67_013617 [Kingdonia uniflora]